MSTTYAATPGFSLIKLKNQFMELDPRIPVVFILLTYLTLGLTVMGFNRTPLQALTTTVACLSFDVFLARVFRKQWIFPLSAIITSLSLSFLLNYSHDFYLLFIPVFYAIASKYLLTYNGKHFFNPAAIAVALSLLTSNQLITASPAYQWNGISSMAFFVLFLGLTFVIPKVNRSWLVMSFLITFTLQTALRAMIMKHHLPFETLFWGTLSSPSFLIFTFFMITDPATSPKLKKDQIIVGICIALVDLVFHIYQSYYTFFLAILVVASTRFLYAHFSSLRADGLRNYFVQRFWNSKYYLRPLFLGSLAILGTAFYKTEIHPRLELSNLDWGFEKILPDHSGLRDNKKGDIYEIIDPRVHNVEKWVLSVGDAVALGDVDGDGKPDMFLTNVLKASEQRAALYLNKGNYQFERFPIPALEEIVQHPEVHGLITNAVFVDYDNSGAQSIFLSVAFGHPILLKNLIRETGKLQFKDISAQVGLSGLYTNSISATFADFNKDGLLDILILNVWPENLPNYSTPHQLNLFHLPQSEHAGDERMFDFMHDSWHMANNGGKNLLLLQTPDHKFILQDSDAWGLPETRWSLAVGVVDINQDGWPDIYVANDFGPDDLYYNVSGKKFENIKGSGFGSIGRDTYKGMNVSIADFDRTGWFGIYISNVHHAFQAEGSLYWSFNPSKDSFYPAISEAATEKSVLNENRFGWGAAAADFSNSGWVDLAQANGMVDDTWDKGGENCPDYWYVNEKVARSPPSIHRYSNKWGDLTGMCIYGHEQNRIYLNRGFGQKPQFVDVADQVGVTDLTNSRGAAVADFENRGRMDLVFTHMFAEATLYKNVSKNSTGPQNEWIGFDLSSSVPGCNSDAIGTRVELTVEKNSGQTFTIAQEVQAVSGFSAQSEKRLHFGLGPDAKAVSAKINWCYNHVENYSQLKKNQYHQLRWSKNE